MVAREEALQVRFFACSKVKAHQDIPKQLLKHCGSQQLLKLLPTCWHWPLHALTLGSNVDYWSV